MNTRTMLCRCGSGRLVGPADLVFADPCYAYEAEERAARVQAWREREQARGVVKDRSERWNLDITPWIRGGNDPDPARRMTYYTGVGHPNHLRTSPVPLFISATTLVRYPARPFGQGDSHPVQTFGVPWAGDSGAYAALMLGTDRSGHPWSESPDVYGSMWVRFVEHVSHGSEHLFPDFIGIQDWPCEARVRARTGMTVRQHQELTLESYLFLAAEFPFLPWLRTLQGQHPRDYVEHLRMYEAAGVEMAGHKVGIGSICRQGSQRVVAAILGTLAPYGMRMHGFGASINALRLAGHLLDSSDSQAWSSTARSEQLTFAGCEHLSRPDPVTGAQRTTDCRNCFRYALAYREEVMDALRECDRVRRGGLPTTVDVEQLTFDLFDDVARLLRP